MQIKPCQPYHAVGTGTQVLRMPDGKSVFKLYYVSIVGRDQPERYEWDRCEDRRRAFEAGFAAQAHEGIGFVVAFPHIAKLFRFRPSAEIVLDVKALDPATLDMPSLAREDGYTEFACYAEAVLAADEYHAWAKAETVEEYLAFTAPLPEFPVANHAKLRAYWGG